MFERLVLYLIGITAEGFMRYELIRGISMLAVISKNSLKLTFEIYNHDKIYFTNIIIVQYKTAFTN